MVHIVYAGLHIFLTLRLDWEKAGVFVPFCTRLIDTYLHMYLHLILLGKGHQEAYPLAPRLAGEKNLQCT